MDTSNSRGPVDEENIVELLTTQGKIAAIKEYRLQTGAQLKDSKEAVEEIARRRGIEVKSGSPAGCVVALLVAALTAGMVYFLLMDQQ